MPGARMPHFWEHNPLFLTVCQFALVPALLVSTRFPVSPELARCSHALIGMNTNTRMTDEAIDQTVGGAVMTLNELHKRIGDIIESNRRHEWEDRNNRPVVIEMDDTRRRHVYAAINYVSGALHTDRTGVAAATVIVAWKPIKGPDAFRAATEVR